MLTKKSPKVAFYKCINCHYITNKKSDYNKHLLTRKHHKRATFNVSSQSLTGKGDNVARITNNDKYKESLCYECITCNRSYKSREGLWYHKKRCAISDNSSSSSNDLTELVMKVIEQNNVLTNKIVELTNNGIMNGMTMNNSNNNNNTNSHNKTFNLQIFLNETCKDAMNITEFVQNIKIQLEDLESVGQLGYVDGISNIIIKNLQDIEITKRPMHCSDAKRETMYIKDEDKWERDSEQKERMRYVVKQIARKNAQVIPKFKSKYPNCGISRSKLGTVYDNIVIESIGGLDDNMKKKENSIIKRVSNTILIDKI